MEQLLLFWLLFLIVLGGGIAATIYYLCFGKNQEPSAFYLLGEKKMQLFPVVMSLIASNLSGPSLLGIPAEIYTYGTQYWMTTFSFFLIGFVSSYVYLPVFYKLQLRTVFEYLELRFDKNIKRIASTLSTLVCFILLPLIIYVPGLAFNQVTGIDLHLIVILLSFICVFYTTIIGVKTAAWTDTLQFSIALCTLCCVVVVGTISVGGMATIWEKAKLGNRLEFFNMDMDPTVRTTFWSTAIGNLFFYASSIAVNQSKTQRFLVLPTLKDSKKAMMIFVSFTFVIKSIISFSGLIIYAKYYDCDPLSTGQIEKPDQILPYYVLDLAKQMPGLTGLFVVGLFSTAISSFSASLNSIAGVVYQHYIKPFLSSKPSDKQENVIIKIFTLLIGMVSVSLIFVMEKLGTILQLIHSLIGITEGPVLGLFTLGMLFPMANTKGAFCGLIGSISFMTFIIVSNQYLIWNGEIIISPKPLYTFGCNITSNSLMFDKIINSKDVEPLWLFRVSFYYYMLMGTIMTITIGLVISYITKDANDYPISFDLFSPCIHRFLPKSAPSDCNAIEEKTHLIHDLRPKGYGTELNDSLFKLVIK